MDYGNRSGSAILNSEGLEDVCYLSLLKMGNMISSYVSRLKVRFCEGVNGLLLMPGA